MALSRIDNHVDLALAEVAEEYKKSPGLKGIIAAGAQQAQDADDAFWQLATERYLHNDAEIGNVTVNYEAIGVQLDVIGRILGLERQNMTDDDYRLALKAKIKVIRSSGTGEELIAVFHAVEPASVIVVTTWPPAYTTVQIVDVITASKAVLYRSFLRQARAGGVAGTLLWQETDDAHSLILSDAAAYPETSALTGLGDVSDPTVGGALSGAQG